MSTSKSTSTRSVRKIEAPRPLKITPSDMKSKPAVFPIQLNVDSVENLMLLTDIVVNGITKDDALMSPESRANLTSNIVKLCDHLKIQGPKLENSIYQGQLDRAFLAFRDAMIRNVLDYESCVHLLEVVELRERGWMTRMDPLQKMYQDQAGDMYQHQFADRLSMDEIVKRSGKYKDRPLRVLSKNYCKDEIVIRNADSGKVMGIKGRRVHMIEQLSETIISFQKVQPTAKERLVQITGPSEGNIAHATHLIEETIRNNSSPVRDLTESEDSDESYEYAGAKEIVAETVKFSTSNTEDYQYKHKVNFNNCHLTITGNDYNYVTIAKTVLDNYFSKLEQADPLGLSSGSNVLEETTRHLNEFLQAEPKYKPGATLPNLDVPLGPTQDVTHLSTQPEYAEENEHEDASGEVSKRYVYTKEFLLSCRANQLSKQEPENWSEISKKFTKLVKDTSEWVEPDVITVHGSESEEEKKEIPVY